MKRTILILLATMSLLPGRLIAQPSQLAAPPPPRPLKPPSPSPESEPHRFDLNFLGGNPQDLIQVINQHIQNPINVIIQEQDMSVQIPPLALREVTVPELFAALTEASAKKVSQVTGTYFGGVNGQASSQYTISTETYGFRTPDAPPTEHSIWYFYHNVAPKRPDAEPEKVCRYFQLAPYLDNYKIEDITTAIETGWWMLDGHTGPWPGPTGAFGGRPANRPQLSFHKDTKLLIAVGDPEKLKLIDSVLEQLRSTMKGVKDRPVAEPAAPAPAKRGEPDKP